MISDNSEALAELLALLSDGNSDLSEMLDEILRDPEAYVDEVGADSSEDILDADILVALLGEQSDVVMYTDWADEAGGVLDGLVGMSDGRITESSGYEALAAHYAATQVGIGYALDGEGKEPSLFGCVREVGLELLGIATESDSYALFLIESERLDAVTAAFTKAGVGLYKAKGH